MVRLRPLAEEEIGISPSPFIKTTSSACSLDAVVAPTMIGPSSSEAADQGDSPPTEEDMLLPKQDLKRVWQ